jgi:hypothetical protein
MDVARNPEAQVQAIGGKGRRAVTARKCRELGRTRPHVGRENSTWRTKRTRITLIILRRQNQGGNDFRNFIMMLEYVTGNSSENVDLCSWIPCWYRS